ncbi:50S ribosomal protein L15 [bacterium DOLZORAL124_38_8]|nr:MAG: 50S ribosomal protein L15 [bacterium DOLZORAL124_38_8]
MNLLGQLSPNMPKKTRKRVGRGQASGQGTFAGRGCKGQNARSGGGVRLGFEGGQSSLLQRMPKLKGFKNPNRVEAQTVSLTKLNEFFADGETVSLETLLAKGLIRANNAKVKVLQGDIEKKLTIASELLISAGAKESVEKAGGSVQE